MVTGAIDAHFQHFDAFEASLGGWTSRPLQLDPGPLDLHWSAVDLDGLAVGSLALKPRIADEAWIEEGWFSVVLCLGSKHWGGLAVEPGRLCVIPPGRSYRTLLSPGWRSLEFGLKLDLATTLMPTVPWSELAKRSPADAIGPRLPDALVARACAWVGGLFQLLQADPDLLQDRGTVRSLQRRTLHLLEDLLEPQARDACVGYVRRLPSSGVVEAALDALATDMGPDHEAAHAGLPILYTGKPVAALAAQLHMSPRTLQHAFKANLGVSPQRYILSRKLALARYDLLRGDEDELTVTAIAHEHGFTHLGRFAAAYRTFFGESPSTTLHRRLRRAGARLSDVSTHRTDLGV